MPSLGETRSSIYSYELENNSVLRAIKPAEGILFYGDDHSPAEALLVPRQISLEACGLVPFLNLKAAPLVRSASATQTTTAPAAPNTAHHNVTALPDTLDEAQRRAISAVLQSSFLSYHVVHFDTTDGTHFTTARGQRGTFSDTLDSISRMGRTGKVKVLCDADPLCTSSSAFSALMGGSEKGERRHQQQTVLPAFHPAQLQVFFIDQPLMDVQEMKSLRRELEAIVTRKSHVALTNDCSHSNGDGHSGLAANAVLTTGTVLGTTHLSAQRDGNDIESDDVVVEEDLSPYASKNESRRKARAAAETIAAATATGDVATALSTAMTERNTHRNIRTHEYSKESIKNYRRVVSADNDIHYDDFVMMMEAPVCAPLARRVLGFIDRAQKRHAVFVHHDPVTAFMRSCIEEINRIPSIASTPKYYTMMAEGVEKFITTQLYFSMFDVNMDDAHTNQLLLTNLERMENTTAQELDAFSEIESHHVWGQAMFELDGMNFFKSPREKLRCGMRACELLSLAVGEILRARRARTATGADTGATGHGGGSRSGSGAASPLPLTLAFGADEFIPCFMLLTLRARPHLFYQNVRYIDKFRCPSLQSIEESYCLATMLSAVEFWLKGGLGDNGNISGSNRSGINSDKNAPGGSSGPSTAAVTATSSNLMALPELPSSAIAAPTLMMRQEDLLPSVRKASGYPPSREERKTSPPVARATASVTANSVMDSLFGWANKRSEEETAAPKSTVRQASVVSGTASAKTLLGRLRASVGPDASAETAKLGTLGVSRKLLIEQNKLFDDLTVSELKAIVAEARDYILQNPR